MEERHVTVDGVRAPGAPAVPGGRHPEPGRDGRHLPAARGAARPVPDEAVGRLPGRGGRDRGAARRAAALPRRARRRSPTPPTVGELVALAQRVHIADPLYAYAVRLAAATREHPQVRVGVSPRGVIALTRAAVRVRADRRPGYVLPEDIKALVEPVFAHRLLLTPDAQLRGVTAAEVLREAVASVPVPLPPGSPHRRR